MRVDRNSHDARDVRSGTARSPVDLSLAASFSTTLRRFQSPERSGQAGARRVDESSSRDGKRPRGHNDSVRDSNTFGYELPEGGSGGAVLPLPASFSLVAQAVDVRVEGAAYGAAPRDARRRRAVTDNETFLNETLTCIEIEHAASGLRCMLSHQGGVWLLSVTQSPAGDEDERALIDGLRAHFQTHGLGDIDVIV